MAETKVYLPDSVDAQLREFATKRFGYGRGSISRAFETAVTQWMAQEQTILGAVKAVVEKASKDGNVAAVILFGSYARKEPRYRDIDFALITQDGSGTSIFDYSQAAREVSGRSAPSLDIVIFEALPLDLKRKVLNEGQVMYARDEKELRELSVSVAEKWDDFRQTFEYLLS